MGLRIESWINTRHIGWILSDFLFQSGFEVVGLNFSICKQKEKDFTVFLWVSLNISLNEELYHLN